MKTPIQYKGYTIELNEHYYPKINNRFIWFPIESDIDDQVQWAGTIEECKEDIDQLTEPVDIFAMMGFCDPEVIFDTLNDITIR